MKSSRWSHLVSLTFFSLLIVFAALFILWSNAHAARLMDGAGNCGNFADAIQLAQDGDEITQMLPARDSGGAVITKNLRISGGWFPTLNCEEPNQVFTDPVEFFSYGFTYNAPAERSELNHNGSVLVIEDANDPGFPNLSKLVIDNMIFRTSGSPLNGGGITGIISDQAEIHLDNNLLNGNFVLNNGGSLRLALHGQSHLFIEDSQFITNTADVNGGGLYVELWDNSRLTIINSAFYSNTALNGGGLEVHVHDGSQLIISNTHFTGNNNYSSLGVGAGGRIFVNGGHVAINGSTFQNNVAGERGGGLYVQMDGGNVSIVNSQFSGNEASTAGGGLYVESVGNAPAHVSLVNTHFAGDTPNAYQFVQSGSGTLHTAVLDHTTFLPVILDNPTYSEQARILSITLDENFNYLVEFETNFQPDVQHVHVHFFFDTVAPEDAGVPGSGPWILYGGSSPFTGYNYADRPDGPFGAEKMCVLVANPDHSVRLNTGNCVKLP
ncbi:MAG: hypothetical protein KJ069_22750 [Anaerolineae bacterium]|nr:hypothetical protein [Anaerolineae bacterium]